MIVLLSLYHTSLSFFLGCNSFNVLWDLHTVGIQEMCVKGMAPLALRGDAQEGRREPGCCGDFA